MDNEKLKRFLGKQYTYAIIGASNNTEKYGYKITKTLIENDFKVTPINPSEKSILGTDTYSTITQAIEEGKKINVANIIVPPYITIKILEEIKRAGIKKVWFQPGSFNEDCINFCKKNNIEYIDNFCLMFESMKNIQPIIKN